MKGGDRFTHLHDALGARRGAFTLIELLVVISIIAVLMAILFPVLRLGREQARRRVCASRIRQQHTSFILYGQDNDNSLLGIVPRGGMGPYPCDLDPNMVQPFGKAGLDPKLVICPSNALQKPGAYARAFPHGYYHCGYWYVIGSEQRNEHFPLQGANKRWLRSLDEKGAAQAEFIVDQTVSTTGQFGRELEFEVAHGAMEGPDQSNHMGYLSRPYGGNVGFLDGHVTWRPYSDMEMRLSRGGVLQWW